MTRLALADDVAALIDPLRSTLDAALTHLPPGPTIQVAFGEVDGLYALDDTSLTLSRALLGPDMHHPDEPAGEARLDRWRRAGCCVAEGAALVALAEVAGSQPDLADWRWVGAALEAVDLACPELQLGLADLLRAAEVGDPGVDPRQGIAVYRALRRLGRDPWAQATAWVSGEEAVDGATWLEVGGFVFGKGLASEVSLPVELAARQDIPVSLTPWTWARIEVPSHRRGGLIHTVGDAVIAQAWASGGRVHKTLAGALGGGGALRPAVGGPVGAWENVSAQGFGQLFGVRGITWTLHADGRLELLLADAFAGPPEALEMAEQVGTSGLAPGRWQVAGDHRIQFAELVTSGLTMHGRKSDPFAVPAASGLGQVLQAIQEGSWAWRMRGEELFLTGQMMGGKLEMRFRPAEG